MFTSCIFLTSYTWQACLLFYCYCNSVHHKPLACLISTILVYNVMFTFHYDMFKNHPIYYFCILFAVRKNCHSSGMNLFPYMYLMSRKEWCDLVWDVGLYYFQNYGCESSCFPVIGKCNGGCVHSSVQNGTDHKHEVLVLLKNCLYVDVSIILQMMDIAARRQMLSLEEVQVPLHWA
jgi:hypothetical protein